MAPISTILSLICRESPNFMDEQYLKVKEYLFTFLLYKSRFDFLSFVETIQRLANAF